MFRIKRLYTFILGTFLPLLIATFCVVLFVLLMQFVWQFVNEMVGKGVETSVLAKLFFYMTLTLTPMALPLAVLLASLMTFGSLSENLELLAMKASGISLLRIMKPLAVCALAIAGISFYFQNSVLPVAQTKSATILYSLKQASPEVDIPEGSFYQDIPKYNIYVRHKDKKTGMLYDLMIYDYSKGFDNAVVTAADSGRLKITEDKRNVMFTLHHGQSFQNMGETQGRKKNEMIPTMRETFDRRDVLIDFDSNFNMADESIYGGSDINKNMKELATYIDSVRARQDSIYRHTTRPFIETVREVNVKTSRTTAHADAKTDSLFRQGFEVYYKAQPMDRKVTLLQQAKGRAGQVDMKYAGPAIERADANRRLMWHVSSFHRRYGMALSCLLFFFIGAPLGAIIRKGGIGLPVVLSVVIYLLYYTVDTFGSKMAKTEVWTPWQGMWLSSVLLVVLGVFFTWQALNDSTMLNPDDWKIALQRLRHRIRHGRHRLLKIFKKHH